MQEMLSVTGALVGEGLGEHVALLTDGRFSRRHPRPDDRPRGPRGRRRRADRPRRGGRHHRRRRGRAGRSTSRWTRRSWPSGVPAGPRRAPRYTTGRVRQVRGAGLVRVRGRGHVRGRARARARGPRGRRSARSRTPMPLRISFKTSPQRVDWATLDATWRLAGELGGWDGAWMNDHLTDMDPDAPGPSLEAITLLATLVHHVPGRAGRARACCRTRSATRCCSRRPPPSWTTRPAAGSCWASARAGSRASTSRSGSRCRRSASGSTG